VADIGAGSGYLSFLMAKPVGPPAGFMRKRSSRRCSTSSRRKLRRTAKRTSFRGWDDHRPKLTPASIDLIILVDVYHEFDHPYEMALNMVKDLKKGGRLVFVEYRKEDPSVPIKPVHKMTVAQVRKEMSIFPLTYKETIEILPRQHIIVFFKK